MKNVGQITVFISSPNDMITERDFVKSEINKIKTNYVNYTFEFFDYSHVPSEFGKPAQDVVNAHLPDYDIYIGLMGARFGSATKEYGSGTEQEFTEALRKKKEGGDVYVALFFKKINSPLSTQRPDDLRQYLQVQEFKNRVSPEGAYQEFETEDELAKHIKHVVNAYISARESNASASSHQREVEKRVIEDVFIIDKDFYAAELNSLGADLTNGYKAGIQLEDVYVPLDVSPVSTGSQDADDICDDVISVSSLNEIIAVTGSRTFITGDESSGKTSLCKNLFIRFHLNKFVPVYIKGSEIKSSSDKHIDEILSKAVSRQYGSDYVSRYIGLDNAKKLIIVDDIDEASLNDKNKIVFISKLEARCEHLIATADLIFFMNLSVSCPKEIEALAEYRSYKLKDMGHALRDALIQNWLKAGREDTITDEELFTTTEKYRKIVDSILGANFVARKPIIVLILLQAINGGTASDFAHCGYVRYYKYLIDTTLLYNIPKGKAELYYAFLPDVAYAVFLNTNRVISKIEFSELIETFCRIRGLNVEDLLSVQSSIIALGILDKVDEDYRFKHPFVYYFFLGQYLSEHIKEDSISNTINEICEKLFIRENANIILFLSHHTRDDLIIKNLTRITNSVFEEATAFGFTREESSVVNQLVEESPSVFVSVESKKERQKNLETRDKIDRQLPTESEANSRDPNDFSSQMNMALRSIEIIGQLLKNHYANFYAEPKRELFRASANASLRMIGVFMKFLSEDAEILTSLVAATSPKLANEKEAKRAIFSIASMIVFALINVNSKYTGADSLSRTYEEVVTQEDTLAFKIIHFAIKLDFFEKFPIAELKLLAQECGEDKLALTTLRNLVKYRLYMRPVENYRERHMICTAVGLATQTQLIIETKGVA